MDDVYYWTIIIILALIGVAILIGLIRCLKNMLTKRKNDRNKNRQISEDKENLIDLQESNEAASDFENRKIKKNGKTPSSKYNQPTKSQPKIIKIARTSPKHIRSLKIRTRVCDCGLAWEEFRDIESGSLRESGHDCKMFCPWILEGCLFSAKICDFQNHFGLHCNFDQKMTKIWKETRANLPHGPIGTPTNSELGRFDSQKNSLGKESVTKETSPFAPKGKTSEGLSTNHLKESKVSCENHSRGVQGCKILVTLSDLQAHLEDPEFMNQHIDLILN